MQNSRLVLGQPNPELYVGDIRYLHVSKPFYWQVLLKDIRIGDEYQNVCPGEPCKAVADTGTSLLTGPTGAIASIISKLGVDASCHGRSRLPLITYVLMDDTGEHEFVIEPDFYVVKSHSGGDNPKYCKPGFMALE